MKSLSRFVQKAIPMNYLPPHLCILFIARVVAIGAKKHNWRRMRCMARETFGKSVTDLQIWYLLNSPEFEAGLAAHGLQATLRRPDDYLKAGVSWYEGSYALRHLGPESPDFHPAMFVSSTIYYVVA